MLTEQRLNQILTFVEEKQSASVQELMELLNASESTIRRDLSILDTNGQLNKVRGGAIALASDIHTKDASLIVRKDRNKDEKMKIAKYAASLISTNDFVYIDAGTTTELMLDFITAKNVTFVTNGISHAKKLSSKGYVTYILGGEFKHMTEAIVGLEALESLEKYNFLKGFFGTNGANIDAGFTTPDIKEALVKKKAIEHCKEPFILCDASKLSVVSSVSFAPFNSAKVITTKTDKEVFHNCNNLLEVDKL